ncbi:uncharacterized protein LOC114254525 isoform X2 [Monomorium pharaonis]|uniref:uncharacterized protein LOC114254525 isoform X2 n=1 Tax=Monomorium pharaonis TaxID=307658 RepID=UPI0017466CBB|nr:uncharacterized protein LOC114254525 isoform X2 [Monomorium pharaonis]
MEQTNDKTRSQYRQKARTESSSSSSLSWSDSSIDSSFYLKSCHCEEEACSNCNYKICTSILKRRRNKKVHVRKKRHRKQFIFSSSSCKKNEQSLKIVKKFKNEVSNNYCPYSSDNCDCSSGCTDCDYALHTYTIKNKSKLKSKIKKPRVGSKRNWKCAKLFRASKVLKKKKKAESLKRKPSESCYAESSSSYNSKSGDIKYDSEQRTIKKRTLKIKAKTSVRNSKNLKTWKIVRTWKLLDSKKVSNKATKVFKIDIMKNWFPDSSNSDDYYSTDCGKYNTTKRKQLVNNFERATASMNLSVGMNLLSE